MRQLLFIFLIVSIFSCKNKIVFHPVSIADSCKVWPLSGFPTDFRAFNTVARKYNIQFVQPGGCVVEQRLSDSMKACRNVLRLAMNKKWGIDWYEKIASEEDVVRKMYEQTEAVLGNEHSYAEMYAALEKQQIFCSLIIDPYSKKNKIIARLQRTRITSGVITNIIYATFEIDPANKTVRKISDNPKTNT